MKSRLFVLCLLLITSVVQAQDFSNKGTDFWLAYPAHIDGNTSRMALYISSTVNTSGMVTMQNGASIQFTVTANQATVVQISPLTYTVLNAQNEGINIGRGIHVTSLQPIVVYAHILNQARSGSTLVLPTNTLGREYTAVSFKSSVNSGSTATNGSNAGSQFTVVAVEDNTTVEITPSVADVGGVRFANTTYTVSLNKGDVYQYRTTYNTDVTGTKIRTVSSTAGSCKPIAVFSGSSWTSLDCNNASGGDNLFLQLMPKSAWGKTYVTAPFADRQYDIFRIVVSDPTTVVTLNGTIINPATLVNGTYYQFNSSTANVITTDKPVMVIQYMISQTCDTRNNGNTGNAAYPGDPEMIIINPVEQTLNDVTVVSARANLTPPNTNITKHFFTIIMKSNATSSLKIDGNSPTGTFQAIGTSGYSYLQENVTNSTNSNPSHRIKADSGFIALAYGLGQVESYGYNAGTSIIDLYQFVSLQNPQATVNFPATCVGTNFKFSITLPYQPTKIKWDFNKPAAMSPNDSVVIYPPTGQTILPADSSFVRDGKTLYVYKITGNYNFNTAGTYPIKVYVTNPTPDGCTGEQIISYDVVVYPKPKTDWSVTSTGCLTDISTFNDATDAGGRTVTNWLWEFGDNTTASTKNTTKTYTAAGTYNIKLTTITDIGCTSDTTKAFSVSTPPVAKFGVSSPRCIGSNITFTDSSTIAAGSIGKWYWDFGNGNNVTNTTNAAVTQTYATVGTYNVSLIVESSGGCKSIAYPLTIQVSPYPISSFTVPNIVCLPNGNAPFINTSTIPDGTQSQFVYAWDFGDGGNSSVKDPVHQYTAVGPFNVKLSVTSNAGCTKDSTIVFNNVFAQPHANFTNAPSEICFRDTAYFTNASTALNQTITSWNWNFGDGNTSNLTDTKHYYNSADTFSVKLYVVSDKGCMSDTMLKKTIVHPLPVAAFITSSPACETKDITFTDQSQPKVGTLTNWYWDFGDATNSTSGGIFAHNYATDQAYNIKLAVQNSKGCKSDTLPFTLNVYAQPHANFILPEVCLNDSYAQFLDSSYISDGTAGSFVYAWKFGDANATTSNPNTANVKDPTHKYTALGNYTAQVKVTSTHGCVDSVARTFTVNGSFPVASYQVQNISGLCSNQSISLKNKSIVTPGDITKVEIYWDWQNDQVTKDVDQVPTFDKIYSHKYPDFQQPATKDYKVRFVAFSGASCTGEEIQTITVNASPKVQFLTIPGICLDASARQITQASEIGGVAKAQEIFTGNTTGISNSGNFNPATAGTGTYDIKYLFISTAGCRDSATKQITVWPSPTAKFGVSNPLCEKNAVTFSDSSAANFSNIKFWDWTFGDGNTDQKTSSASFNYTYPLKGTYNVTLKVTTDSGCVSTIYPKQLIVNALPVVDFSLPSICLPDGRGTFNDQSTLNGVPGVFSYRWNFGDPNDGNPSTQQNPTHKYSALGPYTVWLKVTTLDGCVDSLPKTLTTVYSQPKADFSINPTEVCLGDPMTFNDNSNGKEGTVNQWHWNLGDGSAEVTTQNITYTYTKDSTYKVSLFVYNTKGCVSDTVTKEAYVRAYPKVNAGPDVFVLEGGYIILNPTVTGNNLSYLWNPSTYLDNDTVKNPRFTPGNDQLYMLTVTGIGGCVSKDDLFVKVLRAPVVPNAFSPNGDGINDKWTIDYLESYPGCTIQVFDRYGARVFNSAGYTKPWDGTVNGKPLPVGVYYYIIDPKNGRSQITGSVTILR